MGGKKKKTTIGYKYFMGLHMGLCRGPVDALRQIRVGDKVAWVGNAKENQTVSINQPNLFGGEEQEGGIEGSLQIMLGSKDQPLNTSLASMLGGLVSAFRGVTTTFFDGLVCAMSPYPKEWAYLVQKTKAGWHGGDCWYPEKCEIPLGKQPYQEDFSLPAGSSGSQKVITGGFTAQDLLVLTKPAGLTYKAWSRWSSDSEISNPWLNDFWITDDSGAVEQHWAGALDPITNDPSLRFPTPEAAEAAFSTQSVILTGSDKYTIQISRHAPIADDRGGLSLRVELCTAIGMNPAHILRRLYTDPSIGRGLDAALRLDEPSWTESADTFFNEGLGLCMKWSRTGSLAEFAAEVINHAGAAVYVSRRSGKIVLKPIRANYDIEDLPLFTVDTGLLGIDDDEASAQANGINEIVVNWYDPIAKKEKAVREKNLGAIMAAGGTAVCEEVSYPGIATEDLARRLARRDLQAKSGNIKRMTVRLDRRGKEIMPGHVFRVSNPARGIDNIILRAGRVEFGTHTDGTVTVTALQDVFGLPSTVYRAQEESAYVPPDTKPRIPVLQAVMEAPYRDLSQVLSTTELAALGADASFLHAMAVRPSALAQSFQLVTRVSPNAYGPVSDTGLWCPGGTLSADLHPADVSAVLVGAVDLSSIEIGSAALIGSEIVRVDAVDMATSTITIARGCADTVPASHPVGTAVLCYDSWGADDRTEYIAGVAVDAKLLTRTNTETLDASIAPVQALTMTGRAARPYPPANLMISGQAYPAEIVGGVEVTWSHRDRVTQADRLVDTLQASIGPEPGTTYELSIFDDETDEVRYSNAAITATSVAIPANVFSGRNRLELHALRDGLSSWQRQIRVFLAGFRIEGITPGTANLETYNREILAVGASTPIIWGIRAGKLPSGLHLVPGAGGVCSITGVANDAVGYYPVTIWARDAHGSVAEQSFVIGVGTMLICLPPNDDVGSTSVIDSTGRTWTPQNMQIVSESAAPNGKAFRFTGTGSYATTEHSDQFRWWMADFTIEAFVKNTENNTINTPVHFGASSPTDGTNYWSFGTADGGKPMFYYWSGSQRYVKSSKAIPLDETHHLVMGFSDANTIRLLDNGEVVANEALAATPLTYTHALSLGQYFNAGHKGTTSSLCVLRGIDKYKHGYAVPTSPSDYPQPAASIALNGSLPNGSTTSAYNSSTNIQVSGTVSEVTVSNGALPTSWSAALSGAYIAVTGPATAAGQYAFTLTVQDASGASASLPLVLEIE